MLIPLLLSLLPATTRGSTYTGFSTMMVWCRRRRNGRHMLEAAMIRIRRVQKEDLVDEGTIVACCRAV
jgi:hypothetical protein